MTFVQCSVMVSTLEDAATGIVLHQGRCWLVLLRQGRSVEAKHRPAGAHHEPKHAISVAQPRHEMEAGLRGDAKCLLGSTAVVDVKHCRAQCCISRLLIRAVRRRAEQTGCQRRVVTMFQDPGMDDRRNVYYLSCMYVLRKVVSGQESI